jgi:hypothetical protein
MVKTLKLSLLFLAAALACAGQARAEDRVIKFKAVNGRVTYSQTLVSPVGKQVSFDGKARVRGRGPEREMIFNSFLGEHESGLFRLDYQVEVAGDNRARPPFQAAGKVLLRPGKEVLAAQAGGWKFILELQGKSSGKYPDIRTSALETRLKCGRVTYPVNFIYLPDEQYSAVLYSQSEDTVRKFMVGLLPKSPGLDGTFLLQYTLLLKEGAQTLVENQGGIILGPGAGKQTAAAGKDCVFSAKALR